jgi:hypothetical protein
MFNLLMMISCQQPTASLFQAYVLDEGVYAIENREIPPLQDPVHMIGDYGQMYAGGVFKLDYETSKLTYKEGRQIQMQYVVQNDVFLPLDRDGLILLSFYGHLYDTVQILDQTLLDTTKLFPLDMAVTPHISDLSLAFLPLENAAYVPGNHAFILLSDMSEREIPLAANIGIVAHEFGHSLFHYLTTDGVKTEQLYSPTSIAFPSVSSLDEGFADMVAALVTLDPNFISASLDLPERDLSGEQTAADLEVRPETYTPSGGLGLDYDPYALGSVFASVAWDIYLETQDQLGTLDLIFETVRSFAALEKPTDEVELKKIGYRWLDELVANSTEEGKQIACRSISVRFDTVYEVEECL